MREADNLTNSALAEPMNYVNSTKTDQANPSFCDSLDETIAPINAPAFLGENSQSFDFPALSRWVEAAENGMSTLTPSQRLELVVLIQKLGSSNSNLIKRVLHLEQALAESQKALQLHKQQTQVANSMLTQQPQEVAAAQEQVQCLLQDLEASHQIAQQQEILIETLTTQLESSQERVAQLERECSQIQASYNEHSHQLVQTENTCRELRARLTRQQRQTLQFKLALEKCLEAPVSSYQCHSDTDAFSPVTTVPIHDLSKKSTDLPCFPNVQPIPPWSAQPQSFINGLESPWDSSVFPTPSSNETEFSASPLPKFAQSSIWEWSVEDSGTWAEEEPVAAQETEVESPEPTSDLEEIHSSIEDTSETEEAYWQDLLGLFEAESIDKRAQKQQSRGAGENEEFLSFASVPLCTPDPVTFTPDSNWPSPVVYPLRPPKGRKSLAAIELPTFKGVRDQESGVRV